MYLSVLSQHRETAAVCGNHYAAPVELPLLINHTPRWSCEQQQQHSNAAHRKLSYEHSICKQTMFLGWLFGNCLLCCAHPSNGSPGGASCCTATRTWKTADHLILQEDATAGAGTRLGAGAQPSPCEGPLRSAAGEVTASTLRGKIKVQRFYRKSPPLLENFCGWTEVEHLQDGREQRSSAEP